MTECSAIIEVNNEIDKLKGENKKLNALCVEYGFEMGRLEEENEQLKQDNQRLIKMLDNVANYMQKEHKEIPLDDFAEWWNKMATEGLEND